MLTSSTDRKLAAVCLLYWHCSTIIYGQVTVILHFSQSYIVNATPTFTIFRQALAIIYNWCSKFYASFISRVSLYTICTTVDDLIIQLVLREFIIKAVETYEGWLPVMLGEVAGTAAVWGRDHGPSTARARHDHHRSRLNHCRSPRP